MLCIKQAEHPGVDKAEMIISHDRSKENRKEMMIMNGKSKSILKSIIAFVMALAMVLGAVPLPFMPGSMVVRAGTETVNVTQVSDFDSSPSDGIYTLESKKVCSQ